MAEFFDTLLKLSDKTNTKEYKELEQSVIDEINRMTEKKKNRKIEKGIK